MLLKAYILLLLVSQVMRFANGEVKVALLLALTQQVVGE